MNQFNLFEVSVFSLNILSFMIGFVFGAYVWRKNALLITFLYFGGLAFYYAVKSNMIMVN